MVDKKTTSTLDWFCSVVNGDVGSCAEYIEQGFPVDERNFAGDSALMLAVKLGDLELVQLLVEAGASIGYQLNRNEYKNAFGIAAEYSHVDIVQFFMEHGLVEEGKKPPYTLDVLEKKLRGAIEDSSWDDAELAWKMGAPLYSNFNGDIALEVISKRPRSENNFPLFMRFVRETGCVHGFNNKPDENGARSNSPIVYAVMKGSLDDVKGLFEYGADIKDYYLGDLEKGVRARYYLPLLALLIENQASMEVANFLLEEYPAYTKSCLLQASNHHKRILFNNIFSFPEKGVERLKFLDHIGLFAEEDSVDCNNSHSINSSIQLLVSKAAKRSSVLRSDHEGLFVHLIENYAEQIRLDKDLTLALNECAITNGLPIMAKALDDMKLLMWKYKAVGWRRFATQVITGAEKYNDMESGRFELIEFLQKDPSHKEQIRATAKRYLEKVVSGDRMESFLTQIITKDGVASRVERHSDEEEFSL